MCHNIQKNGSNVLVNHPYTSLPAEEIQFIKGKYNTFSATKRYIQMFKIDPTDADILLNQDNVVVSKNIKS